MNRATDAGRGDETTQKGTRRKSISSTFAAIILMMQDEAEEEGGGRLKRARDPATCTTSPISSSFLLFIPKCKKAQTSEPQDESEQV